MQNICIWHIVYRTNTIGLNVLSHEARKKLDRMNDCLQMRKPCTVCHQDLGEVMKKLGAALNYTQVNE